jgi:hypothetical protein
MCGSWRKEFVPTWLIKLYDHDHPIGVKIVADGRLAFLTPLEPLTEGKTYTVVIADAKDGVSTVIPVSVSLTTAFSKEI